MQLVLHPGCVLFLHLRWAASGLWASSLLAAGWPAWHLTVLLHVGPHAPVAPAWAGSPIASACWQPGRRVSAASLSRTRACASLLAAAAAGCAARVATRAARWAPEQRRTVCALPARVSFAVFFYNTHLYC